MKESVAEMQRVALREIEEKINGPTVTVSAAAEGLTALAPSQLRELLRSGGTTLVEVVHAFHARKQKEANTHRSMVDVFFDSAIAQASAMQTRLPCDLDELPLLGFVLSVKDSILMTDTRSTCGLATNFPHIYRRPSPFIDYLQEKGALILSKGNVPQALMAMESVNNVFGETLHPLDASRTPGGSSGGDAAQLLLQLSNAGLGTDGAGSLRIPALFCGLTTLKVTAQRFCVPMARLLTVQRENPMTEEEEQLFGAVAGAMTRYVNDLVTFTRVFNDYNQRCRSLPPLIWRQPKSLKRIGVLKELNHCPLPAVSLRAVQVCRDRLSALGYELVELDFNEVAREVHRTALAAFSKEKLLVDIIQRRHHMDEPVLSLYSEYISALGTPSIVLRLARRFLAPHRQLIVDALLLGRDVSFAQLRARMNFLREYFIDLFVRNGVEIALFGGFPPALRRGTSSKCSFLAVYTFVWNFVDFVAGALPVVRVKPEEENYTSDDKVLEAALRVSMEGAQGLPVGVQIVGLPYTEEEVVELMGVLEAAIGFEHPTVSLST